MQQLQSCGESESHGSPPDGDTLPSSFPATGEHGDQAMEQPRKLDVFLTANGRQSTRIFRNEFLELGI
jgi:hypothetical protein